MSDENYVFLTGNVGHVTVRKTSTKPMAEVSVATKKSWRGEDGKRTERTNWSRCITFTPKIIDRIEANIKRGARVTITGEVYSSSYKKDEKTITSTDILIANIDLIAAMVTTTSPGADAPTETEDDIYPLPSAQDIQV